MMKNLGFILLLFTSMHLFAQNDNVNYYYPQIKFDVKDGAEKLKKGTATINGRAFTKIFENGSTLGTNRGMGIDMGFNTKKSYAPDNTVVLLFPVTDYFKEWYRLKRWKNKKDYVIMDSLAYVYHLETTTYGKGDFEFKNLKPGFYYIECVVGYQSQKQYRAQVGTEDAYNVYGGYLYSDPVYQNFNYTYSGSDLAQKIVEITTDGQIVEVKLKPQHLAAYFATNEEMCKCYVNNHLWNGTCKEYYPNGSVHAVSEWKDGKYNGDGKFLFEDGKIKAAGTWKKGWKMDTWKYYDESGRVVGQEDYKYRNNRGELVEVRNYDSSGTLVYEAPYKNIAGKDTLDGTEKVYYPSGKIKEESIYKEGQIQSATGYYENGKIKAKSTFTNGLKEGDRYLYDEKGVLIKTERYKAGKLID